MLRQKGDRVKPFALKSFCGIYRSTSLVSNSQKPPARHHRLIQPDTQLTLDESRLFNCSRITRDRHKRGLTFSSPCQPATPRRCRYYCGRFPGECLSTVYCSCAASSPSARISSRMARRSARSWRKNQRRRTKKVRDLTPPVKRSSSSEKIIAA